MNSPASDMSALELIGAEQKGEADVASLLRDYAELQIAFQRANIDWE